MSLNKTQLGGVGLVLLVCSFFFSCFAHSNYGFTYDYNGETAHGGIWKICVKGNCKQYEELDAFERETPFKLRGARACIIMDLVTCLIMGGLLILVILLTGKTGPNFVAAICSETTKVIRLAAAVSFIHFFLLLLASSLMTSEFSADGLVVGWGTGLTWLSWIISLFLLIDLGFLVHLSSGNDN